MESFLKLIEAYLFVNFNLLSFRFSFQIIFLNNWTIKHTVKVKILEPPRNLTEPPRNLKMHFEVSNVRIFMSIWMKDDSVELI